MFFSVRTEKHLNENSSPCLTCLEAMPRGWIRRRMDNDEAEEAHGQLIN